MIDIAQSNNTEESNVEFHTGDIRNIEFDTKFDVVISLFHVLSYQVLNKDLVATFNTAKKHLKKSGVFLFDCWYGPGVLKDPPKNLTKKVENDELLIQRRTTPSTNINENYVDVLFDIEITNKVDNKLYHISENHRMRYLFAPEIKLIGESCGFNEISFSKWMSNELPSENDWYIINTFEGKKTNSILFHFTH